MTLMHAAPAASARRRAVPTYVHVPETFGALPTVALDHSRTWSSMTNGTVICMAHKANGTRRLGEHST